MKNYIVLFMFSVVATLSGCGNKAAVPVVPLDKTSYSDREIAQAAAADHRINLGVDARRKGQIDDKDYVEMNAQLHNAALSSNAATATVKAMRDAEEADRISKGLKKPEPTKAELDQIKLEGELKLEELRLKNAEIRARAERPTIIERVIEKVLVVPAQKAEVRVLTADAGRPQWERVTLDETDWTVYHERTK